MGASRKCVLRVSGDYGACLGGGGGIYPPVRVVILGRGWKSILWVFFGACARFLVVGGMDIPENIFPRCTAVKMAF